MRKKRVKIKLQTSQIVVLLLLIFGCFSCIDVIDLKTTDTEKVLIIEGFIYNGNTPPTVKIRTSAAFSSGPEGVELPVSGANVTLMEVGGGWRTINGNRTWRLYN